MSAQSRRAWSVRTSIDQLTAPRGLATTCHALEDSPVRPSISLLHTTYFREGGPLEVKEVWLQRAERPDLVEYIFAMDADDEVALMATEGHRRVVNSPGCWPGYCRKELECGSDTGARGTPSGHRRRPRSSASLG